RSFISGGSDDARTLKRSSTAVATLLTFWPPGPEARTKRSSMSRSSTAMASVTRMVPLYQVGRPARPEGPGEPPCPIRSSPFVMCLRNRGSNGPDRSGSHTFRMGRDYMDDFLHRKLEACRRAGEAV